MKFVLMFITLFFINAEATLAGGRPNSFSEGNNAFAGVVNPANNVWIEDRLDVGVFWINQKSSLDNRDNNPRYPPGKVNLTYKCRNLVTTDTAVHKKFKWDDQEMSITLASYTMPPFLKLRTKMPIPGSGTTPMHVQNRVDVLSAVFSFKLRPNFSLGCSLDYLSCSHLRNGFQNSDNPIRSVSPGHVTNNGMDHSHGVGFTLGCRWNITKRLLFGAAWTKKSYCGQYRKYRGFEPHHANNYVPQMVGAGFTYRFSKQIAGRIEVLWTNQGNVPGSNNSVLPDGSLNLNKRGSNHSPGPGLTDATFINLGLGYKVNEVLAFGGGLSHRLKFPLSSNIISHTYRLQTIYNLLSFGAHINYRKNEIFLVFSWGMKNKVTGYFPLILGGGKMVGEKETLSLSCSWGYRY